MSKALFPAVLVLCVALFSLLFAFSHALDNGFAVTPPMGVSTKTTYGCFVDEEKVLNLAEKMTGLKMLAFGFDHIIIDCWMEQDRVELKIVPDRNRFPSGIKDLAQKLHGMGFKLGITGSLGVQTSHNEPGTLGYEFLDAKTFSEWGVDYVRLNDDHVPNLSWDPRDRHTDFATAMTNAKAKFAYVLGSYGVSYTWTWAKDVANSWLVTHDIKDDYLDMLRALDSSTGLSKFAGPSAWNDLGQIQFGMIQPGIYGMVNPEYRSHFALWCVLKSPLILDGDYTDITPAIRDTILHRDLLAISKDSLGVPADLIWKEGPFEVYAGPLSDGGRVVVFFNRRSEVGVNIAINDNITLPLLYLGYSNDTVVSVTDVYFGVNEGTFQGSITALVWRHAVKPIRVTPAIPVLPYDTLWRPWHDPSSPASIPRERPVPESSLFSFIKSGGLYIVGTVVLIMGLAIFLWLLPFRHRLRVSERVSVILDPEEERSL